MAGVEPHSKAKAGAEDIPAVRGRPGETPEASDADAAVVIERVLLRTARIRRCLEYVRVAFGLAATAAFVWMLWTAGLGGPTPGWFGALQVAQVGFLFVPALVAGRVLSRMGPDLAALDDVRLIGPLAELADVGDAATSMAVRHALLRLMPQVTDADAARWTPAHRRALYRFLSDAGNFHPLQVALLKALEQVGDEAALPVVRKLADWPQSRPPSAAERRQLLAHHPSVRQALEARSACDRRYVRALRRRSDRTEEQCDQLRRESEDANEELKRALLRAHSEPCDLVREAARDCLPFLEARVEEQRASGRLLRPADAPAAQVLLRPAEPAADVAPERLLRAAERKEEG